MPRALGTGLGVPWTRSRGASGVPIVDGFGFYPGPGVIYTKTPGNAPVFFPNGQSFYSWASDTKRVRDRFGNLTASGANLPGLEHFVDGSFDGVRIEEPSENDCFPSDDWGTLWGLAGVAKSTDGTLGPDGVTLANKLTATLGTATITRTLNAAGATVNALSVWVLPGIGTINRYGVRNATTATDLFYGELSGAGVWTTTFGAGNANVRVEPWARGIYRLIIAPNAGLISAGNNLIFYTGGSGQPVTVGDTLYVSNAQVEPLAYGTSYIPAPTVPNVPRTIDNVSRVLGAEWNAAGGTLVVKARTPYRMNTAIQTLCQFDLNNDNNRARICRLNTARLWCFVANGGVNVASLDLGVIANDSAISVAFEFLATGFSASVNGGAPVVSGAAALPAITHFRLGRSVGGEAWNGTIESIEYRRAA